MPTIQNRRSSGDTSSRPSGPVSAAITPIRKLPLTLATSVAHGKYTIPRATKASASQKRARLPIAPPAATASELVNIAFPASVSRRFRDTAMSRGQDRRRWARRTPCASPPEARRMSVADPLLRPLQLKHLTFKNRVMSTAHAPSYVDDGLPQQRYQLYHEEKAKGGLALTMFGGASSVAADSPSSFGQIDIATTGSCRCCRGSPAHPRPWLRADDPADPCRPADALGYGRLAAHGLGLAACASSSTAPSPRSWRIEDIRRIQRAYGAAARRAKEGGIDGVEVGCSSHLPDQFWSPTMNRRTDGYGGSLANRIRFSLEMFEAIRRAVGALHRRHPHVGARDGRGRDEPGGEPGDRRPTWTLGPDRFHQRDRRRRLDRSRHLQADPDHGPTHRLPFSTTPGHPRGDRPAGVPRDADHRLSTARHAVAEGYVDMVGMTRAHLADPHIVAKLLRGEEDRSAPASAPATASTGSMSAATRSACTTRRPGASAPCRT